MKQGVLKLGFEFRPAAADVPDIGVMDAAFGLPGERGIRDGAAGDLVDLIRRSS